MGISRIRFSQNALLACVLIILLGCIQQREKEPRGVYKLYSTHDVRQLPPGAKIIELGHTLSDEDIVLMGEMPNLEEIRCGGRLQIGDESLHRFSVYSSLKIINLAYAPNITDAGIAYLFVLPKLEELHVIGSKYLTDRSLATLSSMKSLRTLVIVPNTFSAQAILSLRNTLPKCAITIPDDGQ